MSANASATARSCLNRTPAASPSTTAAWYSGVVEQLVDEPFPARVERDRGRDLVVDLDAGREPGLDRELGEEALREGVQRADRGGVELVERTPHTSVGHPRWRSRARARTR